MKMALNTLWMACTSAKGGRLLRYLQVSICQYTGTGGQVGPTSAVSKSKLPVETIPTLKDFMLQNVPVEGKANIDSTATVPYLQQGNYLSKDRRVYFETYGCQMNVNDTEIAWSILKQAGYKQALSPQEADVILAVTCAIREGAEKKVWSRLDYFRSLKKKRSRKLHPLKVGVLGCMAERLKTKILETDKMVDLVVGPDAYKDLPRLLSLTGDGQTAVNVLLSLDETYADVMPVRISQNSKSAFVSIMRGCENMCSYCIVPFTRGKERSRPIHSIIEEVRQLSDQGVREVTLLGQNVNSYRDTFESSIPVTHSTSTVHSRGFRTVYKDKSGGRRFADLLDKVSLVDPEMRIRFTSPHPKDFPDELLHIIKERHNICRHIHLPAQSGNNEVLRSMRRGYTREAYVALVDHIRSVIPDVYLSSDFIAGFCGESEESHKDTLSLIERVRYDSAFLFAYSMRQKTHAYHKLNDDVPHEVKQRRLKELIDLHYKIAGERNKTRIGQEQVVLVNKKSKKSKDDFEGRNDGNIKVIFPDIPIPNQKLEEQEIEPGDYIIVKITGSSSVTLRGEPLRKRNLSRLSLSAAENQPYS